MSNSFKCIVGYIFLLSASIWLGEIYVLRVIDGVNAYVNISYVNERILRTECIIEKNFTDQSYQFTYVKTNPVRFNFGNIVVVGEVANEAPHAGICYINVCSYTPSTCDYHYGPVILDGFYNLSSKIIDIITNVVLLIIVMCFFCASVILMLMELDLYVFNSILLSVSVVCIIVIATFITTHILKSKIDS